MFSVQVVFRSARSAPRRSRAAASPASPSNVSSSRPQIAYRRAKAQPPARACTGPWTVRHSRRLVDFIVPPSV